MSNPLERTGEQGATGSDLPHLEWNVRITLDHLKNQGGLTRPEPGGPPWGDAALSESPGGCYFFLLAVWTTVALTLCDVVAVVVELASAAAVTVWV